MRRVLIGKRGTTWGMWVSKPGVNVETATSGQLLFDSNSEFVRLHATGTMTVGPRGTVTATFAGVGSRPLGFFVYTTNGPCEPLIVPTYPRSWCDQTVMWLVDGQLSIYNCDPNVTESYRWFVFVNVG
jgi:hypothetical protein